jgi:hypothetical protein
VKQLLTTATLVGGAACFASFLSGTLVGFLPLFALGELFLFATQVSFSFLYMELPQF